MNAKDLRRLRRSIYSGIVERVIEYLLESSVLDEWDDPSWSQIMRGQEVERECRLAVKRLQAWARDCIREHS